MKGWLILFALIAAVVANATETCPDKCVCKGDRATCSTVDLTPFKQTVTDLQLKNTDGPLKLTKGIFKNLGLKHLQTLKIENANIVEIDENAFEGLSVYHLVIRNSNLPGIQASVFTKMPNLRIVDFTNSKINMSAFDIKSDSVQEIILSGCGIVEIPEKLFAECIKLGLINFENNQIEDFTGNYEFTADNINLSNNKITHFEINENLDSVVSLDLSNNPIKSIEGEVKNIETLNLSSCNLHNLDFLHKFTVITQLDISNNKITTLNKGVFKNLPELEIVNFSNNEIKSLPDAIFQNNLRLSKVLMDGNPMKTFPIFKSQKQIVPIRFLSCSNCQLEKLDENTFINMPSLITIDMSNNHLSELPETLLQPVSGLVKINLTNNSLTQLPEKLFIKNSALSNVALSRNSLTAINPVLFQNNKVLKELDISFCNLSFLWETTNKNQIKSLETLNAEYNQIGVITIDALNVTPNLKTLLVYSNSLLCNEVFMDMRKWIKHHSVSTLKNIEEISSNPSVPIEQQPSIWELCADYQDDVGDNDDMSEEYYDASYYDNIDNIDKIYPSKNETEESLSESEEIDNLDYPVKVDVIPTYNKYPSEDETNYDSINEERELSEDAKIVDDIERVAERSHPVHKEFIVYLLPTLVFVLTALIVLILTVTVILFVMQKRNSRRNNIPQINILPWNAPHKMKINSGIVYQSLSEEKIPV